MLGYDFLNWFADNYIGCIEQPLAKPASLRRFAQISSVVKKKLTLAYFILEVLAGLSKNKWRLGKRIFSSSLQLQRVLPIIMASLHGSLKPAPSEAT